MANGKRQQGEIADTNFLEKRKLGDELGHDRLPISPQVLTINKC